MSVELDEKGHDAGTQALLNAFPMADKMAAIYAEIAIRAYLSTVALPDELEVVAWRGGKDDGSRKYTEIKRASEIWADQNLTVIPLVRADQAHSIIAALRAEVEHWRDTAHEWNGLAMGHAAEVQRLTEEKEVLRNLADRLKLEAQCHASEAKTANSTIYEIYQVLSGGKGEPGNWHGAEPARRYVEAAEARIKALEEALRPFGEYLDRMPFDLDNEGKPLPDDTGPGWTYLTAGHFRAARAALKENAL